MNPRTRRIWIAWKLVIVHPGRKPYRHLLRDEIARTLADPAHVDEGMRTLFVAFRDWGNPVANFISRRRSDPH